MFSVRIHDDEVDFRNIKRGSDDEEELYFGTKEEKPMIAEVVDDRPLAKRTGVNEKKSKWKRVGGDDEEDADDERSSINTEPSSSKAKTLSGKKAGLSNAKDIKKELADLKRKNDKLIHKLDDDVSGKNAKTVFRDRKTGKIRDVDQEMAQKAEEDRKAAEKEAARKAVYDKWSQGIKQGQQREERLENDLHEMSKPLARHEGDEDLEKHLKDQERADDPMLNHFRVKKEEHKKATDPNYKVYPKYKGPPPPPNRLGILPGYRWDGVNRSNGYEAKWFAKMSHKESIQEEAYRWSTQDM